MQAIPLIGGAISGVQSLFGGDKAKSQSTQSSSSTPTDLTLPWFQQLGQTAASTLGNFLNAGTSGSNIYNGPLTAGIGEAEQFALNSAQQLALNPQRTAFQNALMSGQFMPGQTLGNQFLNPLIEMAQRPTMEALQHAAGRQIPGMFAAQGGHQVGQTVGGGGSTAKDLNLIRASEVGGRALGDIATGISNNAWNTGFAGALQGAQLQQGDIGALIANAQLQGVPRLIEEGGINRAIALGQQGIGNWLQGLQTSTGLPLQTVGNTSQSSGSSTATGASNLSQSLFGNQGIIGGLNSALAPTTMQGGQQAANATIFNTGYNPFAGLFG